MNKFIFGQRNGIYILDLQQTRRQLVRAYQLVRDVVAAGGDVLFVGTKKQAQEVVAQEAARCNMFYVNNRWLGGTLTNFMTIQQSIRRLLELEEMEANGKLDALSKKEASRIRKQKVKLEKNLSGIKSMKRLPGVMFVIDTKKEAIAVREAQRMNIPCIGVVDTNADPDAVYLPVPGNDDAIRAISLYSSIIANAALEGQTLRQKTDGRKPGDEMEDSDQDDRASETVSVAADADDEGDFESDYEE